MDDVNALIDELAELHPEAAAAARDAVDRELRMAVLKPHLVKGRIIDLRNDAGEVYSSQHEILDCPDCGRGGISQAGVLLCSRIPVNVPYKLDGKPKPGDFIACGGSR